MTDHENRRLLSTAFEPNGVGFLYYKNRWAGGVLVSAEERETYISAPGLESISLGREFSKRTPHHSATSGKSLASGRRNA